MASKRCLPHVIWGYKPILAQVPSIDNQVDALKMQLTSCCLLLGILGCFLAPGLADGGSKVPDITPELSLERVVFQLETGDFEFGFYPEVAPVTTAHIFKLVQLGLYTTNHIFRVDKGFVAQVADVAYNRLIPLNAQQKEHAYTKVPLEVKEGVRHHEGVVSMARADDPGSGGNSFFICYGNAPHLDMNYAVFGRITKGMDVLHDLEKLPTKREGIFVMPVKRVTLVNTYWYSLSNPQPSITLPGTDKTGQPTIQVARRSLGSQNSLDVCQAELKTLKIKLEESLYAYESLRKQLLP